MSPMEDQGRGGRVGSVAEETARLLDALLGQCAPETAASSHDHDHRHDHEGHGHNHEAHRHEAHDHDDDGARPRASTGGPGHRVPVGEGSTCSLCPVCQLIGVARSVRPETVDRLADLAAALTQSLRDLALERWAQTTSPDAGRPGARAPKRHRAEVEDIALVDEADDELSGELNAELDGELNPELDGERGDDPGRDSDDPDDPPLPGLDDHLELPS